MIYRGFESQRAWKEWFREKRTPILAYHYPHRVRDEARHEHDFFEIQLCAGGEGKQQSPIGDLPFRRGDVLLLRPGSWHFHHENRDVDAYVCCFSAELLRHELFWTIDDPGLNQLLWRSRTGTDAGISPFSLDDAQLARCIRHLDDLEALGEEEDDAQLRPVRIAHLLLILSALALALPQAGPAGTASRPVHMAVKRGMSLMEENISAPWTLGRLARDLNVDPSYLSRLFKDALGFAPVAFLHRLRAERAARLLMHGRQPIAEIANQVGWPDPNHFARRFRAHFGVSASEYRNRKPSSLRA